MLHSTAATATSVRPFAEADIPQVAALHRRVFRPVDGAPRLDTYRRYFSEVFLAAARGRHVPASLVYERQGTIHGFLGVAPRRMLFRRRPILMAVCSQFVVDPAVRGQVGLRLLKACFDGPQDLTISDESGDGTRRIWEWCGGDTVLPYSLRWVRPLRPAQYGVSLLARRSRLSLVARALAPEARLFDAAAAALGGRGLVPRPPRGSREALHDAAFAAMMRELTEQSALRPDHDARSAAWALARAGARPGYALLQKLLVRNESRDAVGVILYCVGEDRIAEVLQVAARPDAINHVLDHLFEDATRRGAVAVAGRFEPALADALSRARAVIHRGRHWTLLHSNDPELRLAVHRGDAFLSRLEGEWCLRFP